MRAIIIAGIILALGSATLTNLAYVSEHDAAAELPPLSIGRPAHSVALLLSSRRWLRAFLLESVGFLLYAAAVRFAPLALVQSFGAGGIGILAFVSARVTGRRLSMRESAGVALSVLGLLALAASLAGGSGNGGRGALYVIGLWIGATAGAAAVVLAVGRPVLGTAIANGVAGGLLFSIGDFSTKLVTQGGMRIAFAVTLVVGYTLGTSLIQIGYQSGSVLNVAGISTLLTSALPIAAGTVALQEPLPTGVFGALRVAGFGTVTVGAYLLARPQSGAGERKGQADEGARCGEGTGYGGAVG